MNRKKDEEEVCSVGSEHESVNSECEMEDGSCEGTETDTDDKNDEWGD
jgi:hypothetical protein